MAKQTASKVPQIRFKGFEGEWEEKELGKLADIKLGKMLDKAKHTSGQLLPYLNNISLRWNDVDTSNLPQMHFKDDELERFGLQAGDVVVCEGGEPGRSAIWDGHLPNLKFQKAIHRVRFNVPYEATLLVLHLQNIVGTNRFEMLFTGGGIKHLTRETFSLLKVPQPSLQEQRDVALFLSELDRLIGLHQRKNDKLQALKKAMLQKMFPQLGATTPQIRFKGFEGGWMEKKMEEVMTNVSNNTLSRAHLNSRSGLARNIHYGDILVRFGEVLDVQSDGVPFISDDIVAKKLMFSNLEDGDIVLADAAEDEMVGKCTEIHNVGDQIVLAGLHTIPLRPLINFAPFYLGYYLNSDGYHDQLLPIMQGTKVLSISKSGIKQTKIYFPIDDAEQKKIGSYFYTLDKLISTHAIQLRKLQQIKSACLEKMFV